MEKITIEIATENAAFEDSPGYEIAHILRDLADGIDNHDEQDWPVSCVDYNGNKVGTVTIE